MTHTYVGAMGPQNFHNVQIYFVHCMAPVHVRDRKTQRIQVVQKDMYAYKSQKCDLYAVRIVIYGLSTVVTSSIGRSLKMVWRRYCGA